MRIVVDSSNYLAMIRGAKEVLRDEHTKSLQRLGLAIAGEFQRKNFGGDPNVKNRTGFLRRGVFQNVQEIKGGRELLVGIGGVKYARIQEFGGIVRPKRAKWLTIPVGPAKTAAGVARGPARSFPGLKFVSVNRALALLVGDHGKGKNAKPTVFFVLKKEVRLRPRLGFYPSFRAWFGGRAKTFLQRTIRNARGRLRGKQTR